jgi:hypothetical protein
MMFRPGQKVVCVGTANPSHINYGEAVPEKGKVYTVRDIALRDGPALRLIEIVNPAHLYLEAFEDCWFDQAGFRPAVDRKTDISFAHEILREASKRETLPA